MIGEENETEVQKGHEVETKEMMEKVVQKLIVIEEKASNYWGEGFPLVPLEFW